MATQKTKFAIRIDGKWLKGSYSSHRLVETLGDARLFNNRQAATQVKNEVMKPWRYGNSKLPQNIAIVAIRIEADESSVKMSKEDNNQP